MNKTRFTPAVLMAAIHLIVVLSLACFGTMILTLGILAIPAMTSAFIIGKDVIYKRFDVHDGLLRRFFTEMFSEMKMMKYFPMQLLILMQLAGIYAAEKMNMQFLAYLMIACISFVLALIIYTITYHIFYKPYPTVTEVLIAMFYRVHYFTIVWIAMILLTIMFGVKMLGVMLLVGTAAILLIEVVAFLGIIGFKKLKKELTDEEKEFFGEDMLKKL